jgi:hypothetical protein
VALPNGMSLCPGLLSPTLNLVFVLSVHHEIIFLSILHAPYDVFANPKDVFANSWGYAYTRLKTTAVSHLTVCSFIAPQSVSLHIHDHIQSHITIDGQSISMSWCRAQSGTFDQRFFFKLRSCLCGAPSLTRGRACHLSLHVNTVYSSQSVSIYINYLHKYTLCVTYFHDLQYIQASFSPGLYSRLCPTH